MIVAPLILLLFAFALLWLVWVVFFLANDPSEEIGTRSTTSF